MMRRRYERPILKTGQVSTKTTYGITSLRATEAGAAELEVLWRGHWTIEMGIDNEAFLWYTKTSCVTGCGRLALSSLYPVTVVILRNPLYETTYHQ